MENAKTVNHIIFVYNAGFVIITKLYIWKINLKNKMFQQEEIMNIINGKELFHILRLRTYFENTTSEGEWENSLWSNSVRN